MLKSWAVPKGPSLDPGEKRLAVHVEDHPIDYGDFEGIIPKGQYGGGTVLLWDRGTWEPEGDPVDGLQEGAPQVPARRREAPRRLAPGAHARRAGRTRSKENWLLFKENDEAAVPGSGDAVVQERPESVDDRPRASRRSPPTPTASGSRTAPRRRRQGQDRRQGGQGDGEGHAAEKTAKPASIRRTIPGARKAAMPAAIEPQLATLVDAAAARRGVAPRDQVRRLPRRSARSATARRRLITRHGKDWTDRFAPVAREPRRSCPVRQAMLDGEVVVLEPDGTTSFQALQNALAENRQDDLVYFAFDLLYLDGYDLRGAPLVDRKAALARAPRRRPRRADPLQRPRRGRRRGLLPAGLQLRPRGDHLQARRPPLPLRPQQGLAEGEVPEAAGVRRSSASPIPRGSRVGFGALLLGVHDDDGELVYAGKVGTGFNDRTLRELRAPHGQAGGPEAGLQESAARRRGPPQPLGEAEAGRRGGLHRVDRGGHPAPSHVPGAARGQEPGGGRARESPDSPAGSHTATAKAPARKTAAKKTAMKKGPKPALHPAPEEVAIAPQGRSKKQEVEIAGVRFSNPGKVLYPEQGVTKEELGIYYARISEWILPHLADRPLTLVRCPEGRAKQCFYQKHVNEHVPPRSTGWTSASPEPYGAVDSLEGLLVAGADGRAGDPHLGLAPRQDRAARLRGLRSRSRRGARLGAGGRGRALHARLPGGPRPADLPEEHRRQGAPRGAPHRPQATTGTRSRRSPRRSPRRWWRTSPGSTPRSSPRPSRKGKIFIDYLRNGRGRDLDLRLLHPLPGERAGLRPPLLGGAGDRRARQHLHRPHLPERLENLPSDPWADFFKVRQSITAAMKKAVGMK